MIGSAVYGFCLGVLVTAVNLFAPQPTGAVLLWAGFALQLAWLLGFVQSECAAPSRFRTQPYLRRCCSRLLRFT